MPNTISQQELQALLLHHKNRRDMLTNTIIRFSNQQVLPADVHAEFITNNAFPLFEEMDVAAQTAVLPILQNALLVEKDELINIQKQIYGEAL